jgi:hypothetical protein
MIDPTHTPDTPAEYAWHALGVIVFDPVIKAWLSEHDPKAYQQAKDAFDRLTPEFDRLQEKR